MWERETATARKGRTMTAARSAKTMTMGEGGLALAMAAAFLWSLRSGQYDDLDGAAWRAILDDDQESVISDH